MSTLSELQSAMRQAILHEWVLAWTSIWWRMEMLHVCADGGGPCRALCRTGRQQWRCSSAPAANWRARSCPRRVVRSPLDFHWTTALLAFMTSALTTLQPRPAHAWRMQSVRHGSVLCVRCLVIITQWWMRCSRVEQTHRAHYALHKSHECVCTYVVCHWMVALTCASVRH